MALLLVLAPAAAALVAAAKLKFSGSNFSPRRKALEERLACDDVGPILSGRGQQGHAGLPQAARMLVDSQLEVKGGIETHNGAKTEVV